MGKTRIFFSKNVTSQLALSMSRGSGFSITNNLGKYFGVPFFHNRMKNSTYNYILEKIQERLSGWKMIGFLWREGLLFVRLCYQPYPFILCNQFLYPNLYAMKLKNL